MDEIKTQLKKLILDDNFTNIQNMVSEEINLMSILKIAHKELQHSNFLAWLFDPKETHGLNDFFIKEFLKLYYRENEYHDLDSYSKLSVFDFVNLDFSDIEIQREHKNIDIFITSKSNDFCIVIENKIFAVEGKGQLKKYRRIIEKKYSDFKHKIFIYLSLFDQEITDTEKDYYIQITYEHIVKLIHQTLNSQIITLRKNTRFVLEQYLQTLRTIMNENEEIEKIAKNLYKKYKSAFDLVFKYVASSQSNLVPHNLKDLIENESSIRSFNSSNTYIRFQPNFLYDNIEKLRDKGFIKKDDTFTDNWLFLFEFNVRRTHIQFDMKIGQYDDASCREKLYKLFLQNKSIFNKVEKANGVFSKTWHQAFQKKIVSKSEYEKLKESDEVNLDDKIEKRFKELIKIDLPKIQKIIEAELK